MRQIRKALPIKARRIIGKYCRKFNIKNRYAVSPRVLSRCAIPGRTGKVAGWRSVAAGALSSAHACCTMPYAPYQARFGDGRAGSRFDHPGGI